jgi:RNA polymerase sigma factor (TIGR02999 family)
MPEAGQVTQLLQAVSAGEEGAESELVALVYAELRRMARARMAREKSGQTLQPTALVHEVYLQLLRDQEPRWENRAHFFTAAAEAMRRILIQRARSKSRLKRGGDLHRVELDSAARWHEPRADAFLALDQALNRLEARDPEMAGVVKLRYFAGLTIEETARILDTSPRSVNRQWAGARAWLNRELSVDRDSEE